MSFWPLEEAGPSGLEAMTRVPQETVNESPHPLGHLTDFLEKVTINRGAEKSIQMMFDF